jgi:hypothetical protein
MIKIYTLEWIEREANLITGYWNGNDDRFIDGNGDPRHAEEAMAANELLQKLTEVKELIMELSL